MNELSRLRMAALRLIGSTLKTPTEAVRWLLAVQAQDLPGAKWALGLRVPGCTLADVDAALAAGTIVRSWPMRGTLHLTAAEDLPWMLALLTPRVIAGLAKRQVQLALNAKQLAKARDVASKVLTGKQQLTRKELLAAFDKAKLDANPHRGYHILFYLAQTGHICMGPGDSYVLIEEWITKPRVLDREASLRELALRYFRSHGPSTLDDLVRWAKLTMPDGKLALERAKPELAIYRSTYYMDPRTPEIKADVPVLALPGFDELILGYQDRSCTLPAAHADAIVPGGNGMFISTIVANGEVVGTWARTPKPKEIVIEARPFAKLSAATQQGFTRAAASYGAFVGKPVRVV